MTRVLVADDHPIFLGGLLALLETVPGIEVVGSAGDGDELLALAASTEFDVAVLDLDLPGADGATVTEALLRRHPGAGVLILTMHDDADSLRRCLRAGARGYVVKGAGHGSVARAVAAVAEGDTVISGDLGRAVRSAASAGALAVDDGLTPREREVLGLVREGLDNPVIARRLGLSVKTVQNIVSSLLAKLGAGSRVQLIVAARPDQERRSAQP